MSADSYSDCLLPEDGGLQLAAPYEELEHQKYRTIYACGFAAAPCGKALPYRGQDLLFSEVETYSQTQLTRAERARGYQKRIEERLTLLGSCSRSKGIKIYELAAEAENRFVE
jgi:hypothetical protein